MKEFMEVHVKHINGNMFPMFVQLRLHPVLSDNNTDDALETVSEGKTLKCVETLGGYCPTNRTNVSMVIADSTTKPNSCK
ncbi:hypothetical protein BG011_003654 [Mortierella polycephala]|uniref:Uncharacterized protein n=1 Tax=Mortierella polycephala TaxID=41804 RepID=A0A9P6QD62_9FUNG|nr:hypothetical protein BG011_003654 [Mortierella polycephala]